MFSSDWEEMYGKDAHLSVWPWTDLVSLVMQNRENFPRPLGLECNLLEIGCGVGANVPFFINASANYFGIDGSKSAIQKLKRAYPSWSERFIVGDFTQNIPLPDSVKSWDVIVDRASLTHNSTASIEACLAELSVKLTDGAYFFGIDWFSTEHSDFQKGHTVDSFTKAEIDSGQFVGLGVVHFSDSEHLIEIFERANFEILKMEHKSSRKILPAGSDHLFSSFNFVARFMKRVKQL